MHKHFFLQLLTFAATALTTTTVLNTRPAQAQTTDLGLDSVTEQLYKFLHNQLAPTQAPAVYPDPLTGQPQPWSPQNQWRYDGIGVRG